MAHCGDHPGSPGGVYTIADTSRAGLKKGDPDRKILSYPTQILKNLEKPGEEGRVLSQIRFFYAGQSRCPSQRISESLLPVGLHASSDSHPWHLAPRGAGGIFPESISLASLRALKNRRLSMGPGVQVLATPEGIYSTDPPKISIPRVSFIRSI